MSVLDVLEDASFSLLEDGATLAEIDTKVRAVADVEGGYTDEAIEQVVGNLERRLHSAEEQDATDYDDKYTRLINLLNAFGTEVAAELVNLSGAAVMSYSTELSEVLDSVNLAKAAAAEIDTALQRYRRASAPMAEQKHSSGRMFK